MSILAIVYELRRFPRAIALAVVLALAVGLAMTFRISGFGLQSRHYEIGYARAAALVDTEPSQAVDGVAAGGSISELTDRAVLLADLMTRAPLRDEIAARAGVPRGHLLTERPMNGLERRLTLHEVSTATVGSGDRDAYLMRVAVNPLLEGENPIIGVEVRAPTPARAAALAGQAIATLRLHLSDEAAQLTPRHELAIRQLDTPSAEAGVVGPSRALAMLAALATFGILCAAILAVSRLGASVRRSRLAV
jgi:hypothetical protein